MPGFLAKDKPRIYVRLFFMNHGQVLYKFIPGSRGGQSQLVEAFLVVEETGHGHIGADAILLAGLQIRAAFPHGGNQAIPPFVHVAQIHVLALIHEFLLIRGHHVGHFTAGEFHLDDRTGIVLVFLLHYNAGIGCVKTINDFVE